MSVGANSTGADFSRAGLPPRARHCSAGARRCRTRPGSSACSNSARPSPASRRRPCCRRRPSRANMARPTSHPTSRRTARPIPTIRPMSRTPKNGFADWKLSVGGLVEAPLDLSLAELRAMPSRTQITRHDCVEGWSCIGKWTGAKLGPCSNAPGSSRTRAISCSIAPTMLGSTGTEADRYYEFDRACRRLSRADHSRLRDERPDAAHSARRPATAPGRAAARLQDGEICDADRGGRKPRRHQGRPRRFLGGSRL